MPTRMLREGFVTSERIGALSDDAFRFYFSLFALVDDYGCIEWNPTVLRGKLYPYDEPPKSTVKICDLLQKCISGPRPLILKYEVSGKEYIQIQEFDQRKQSKPRCPLPVIHGEKPRKAESEAEAESSFPKAESKAKSVAPPLPDFEPTDGDVLVESTRQTLIGQHTAGGLTVTEPKLVGAELAQILFRATNRPAVAASIVQAHRVALPDWPQMRNRPKDLHWWLKDEGYLGVKAPAKTSPTPNRFNRADLPR